MKKCKDCEREIDKYAIACQYCGKLMREEESHAAAGKERKSIKSSDKSAVKDSD